jgi:hypothetical protein
MRLFVSRLLLVAAASWAVAACGRLGFDEVSPADGLRADASADTATDSVPLTVATAPAVMPLSDAPVVYLDAGPSQDATLVLNPTPVIDASDPGNVLDATTGVVDATTTMTLDAGTTDAAPATCPTLPPRLGTNVSIDDLEDGDALITASDGRGGGWYVNNDATSGYQIPAVGTPFEPVSPGAHSSVYSARTTGTGFNDWGAAVGVVLNDASGLRCPYDAASARGLRFLAKGTGTVTLSVGSASTVPVEYGGRCRSACYDYHATTFVVSSAWSMVQIPWTSLAQGGWGTRAVFSPSGLMFIEFAFGAGATFDFSIDDLAFY